MKLREHSKETMCDTHLLSTITTKDPSGTPFLRFANADGKCWIMPEHTMVVAMQLYQPSGIKGKLLKRLLPYLYRIGAVQRIVHATRVRLTLASAFKAKLEALFGTETLDFAIFCGTPCVHQKITVQISRGKHILAYAKVSNNTEVSTLFVREATTMDYLARAGVETMPRCLYVGNLVEGVSLFVQSTTKTLCATTTHQWTRREIAWLQTIHTKTRKTLAFEQSDFYTDLYTLQQTLDAFSPQDRDLLQRALDMQFKQCGSKVCYSFYHGDFTPWNTYIVQGKLYAFDLEYARYTYPPYLDYWHFYTQTALFEQGRSAADVYQHYAVKAATTGLFSPQQMAASYVAYLLAVIAHYTQREQGHFEGDLVRSMALWLALLRKLLASFKD